MRKDDRESVGRRVAPLVAAERARAGCLVIIGGAEDKTGDREILRHVAQRAGSDPLVVVTVATSDPEGSWKRYDEVFRDLGVERTAHVDVRDRREALEDERSRVLEDAAIAFFTGGDQLRLTSQLGDTPVYRRLLGMLERGGTIAGTSAGASVMSETMLVSGESGNSPALGEVVQMAPGFGFLHDAIIDQHFAERGRIGRLIGAVAQNPRVLGIGIDEDTAIVVDRDCVRVIGSGAVYIVDGARVSGSNVAEGRPEETLQITDVTLHMLARGGEFDLATRRPSPRE